MRRRKYRTRAQRRWGLNDDAVNIQFTCGTMELPEGVTLSRQNLLIL